MIDELMEQFQQIQNLLTQGVAAQGWVELPIQSSKNLKIADSSPQLEQQQMIEQSHRFLPNEQPHSGIVKQLAQSMSTTRRKGITLSLESSDSSDRQAASNLLDQIPQTKYSEQIQTKITNLKMNYVSLRRKDELFKRYRREQEDKIVQRRNELEKKYRFDDRPLTKQEFAFRHGDKQQIFTIKKEDLEKLSPEADLNDTIINNYLKIVPSYILTPSMRKRTHVFSSFLMTQLLSNHIQNDYPLEKEDEQFLQKTRAKVKQNYSSVKRWTRKIDLFSLQYLVVPIVAFKHWNCLIVVSPRALCRENSGEKCQIIYLDSMVEKRLLFCETIKTYLEMELASKKNIKKSLNSVEAYQLLVPRQTNTHDCGLYTLSYIEHFLSHPEKLDARMDIIENREHLKIFPRSLIFTMRQFLIKLFHDLIEKDDQQQAIREYISRRQEVIENSIPDIDYDEINEREFKKFYRITEQEQINGCEDQIKTNEAQFHAKIKFYLDADINHFEKDRLM